MMQLHVESPLRSTIKFLETFLIIKIMLVYSNLFYLTKIPNSTGADSQLIWQLCCFKKQLSNHLDWGWNPGFEQRRFSPKICSFISTLIGKMSFDSYIV